MDRIKASLSRKSTEGDKVHGPSGHAYESHSLLRCQRMRDADSSNVFYRRTLVRSDTSQILVEHLVRQESFSFQVDLWNYFRASLG